MDPQPIREPPRGLDAGGGGGSEEEMRIRWSGADDPDEKRNESSGLSLTLNVMAGGEQGGGGAAILPRMTPAYF